MGTTCKLAPLLCQDGSLTKVYEQLKTCYIQRVRKSGHEPVFDYELVDSLERITSVLDGTDSHRGFLLCGGVGSGKTTALEAVQLLIGVHYWIAYDYPYELRIVSAKRVVSDEAHRLYYGSLLDEPLLAIDDLGAEAAEKQSFGNVATPVIDLIETRYARRLFTAFTTNLTPAEITARYGSRVIDRMREMCRYIVFKNKSFRK